MIRIDLAIIVSENPEWSIFENELFEEFKKRNIPIIPVFNKSDINNIAQNSLEWTKNMNLEPVITSAKSGMGINELKQAIIKFAPEEFFNSPQIISDLIPPGEMAILVVPIDLEAPKGRLILPQVQTIRDLLDNDSLVLIVKERELRDAINRLNIPPYLVITDSQAFLKVSADVPKNIKLTSFSILFARFKGELNEFVRGATAIQGLKPDDKVLICESCTHHAIGDDIGRVKIPRWLTQYVGGKLQFEHYSGT